MEEDIAKGVFPKKMFDNDLQTFNDCKEPNKKILDSSMDKLHTSPDISSKEIEENTKNKRSCISSSPIEESQSKLENGMLEPTLFLETHGINTLGTKIEAIENKAENSIPEGASGAIGASGLHILTNQEVQEDEDGRAQTTMNPSQKKNQKKGTSEITDEGAVIKFDSKEASGEILQLPKPYKGRPGVGCRLMVEVSIIPNVIYKLKGNWSIFC